MKHPLTAPGGQTATEATRAKLLDAAGEVFAEVGYDRATVRQICARAGVNGALVNYHFGGKLELYSEVLNQLVSAARIEAVRVALNQKAPPEDVLREAITARLRSISAGDETGRLFRILTHEIAQPTPPVAHIINGVSRPLYSQLCGVVGAIIGLPADDEKTRLCTHSVLGQVLFYLLASPLLARLWPELKLTPEQLDHIALHITEFSLAYLRQVSGVQHNAGKGERRRKRK